MSRSCLLCPWVAAGLLEAFDPGCSQPSQRSSDWNVFRGADKLLICFSACNRFSGFPSDYEIFRGAVKLLSCVKLFSRVDSGLWFLFPCVQQNSREAFCLLGQLPCMPQSPQEVFRLWCWVPHCPMYRGTPGMPSSCGVFREADKLVISFSVALCAADLLGCLRLWCQLTKSSECRASSGMAQDMVSTALSAVDPLGWLRI